MWEGLTGQLAGNVDIVILPGRMSLVMREALLELVVHGGLLGFYVLAALVSGGIGLVIEYHSVLYFIGGEYEMAAWVGFFGLLALVFSYLVIRDKILPLLGRSGDPAS